jgi:F0F1-type ATP synthase delta subunit
VPVAKKLEATVAKLSYRRLAVALATELKTRSPREVAAATVDLLAAAGQKLDLERLLPELERELLTQHGHAVVHATSDRPLPAAEYDQVAAELARRLGAKDYEVDAKVDPAVLGGIRLATADAQLDLTVQTQLEQLMVHHG